MSAAMINSDWIGRTVDGTFPLIRWLGGSESDGVFATEAPELGELKAAIRVVTAQGCEAESRVAAWRAAAALSHPHLLRVFGTGECAVDGTPVVYCVTEYADEILADAIRERALTADEVRQMLEPLLEVLDYVHAQGFVLGRVKPARMMAVKDCLKISAEDLRPVGTAGHGDALDAYDAPETATGPMTPASDTWSLGVMLVEALTRHVPLKASGDGADPVIPPEVPAEFRSIARECLLRDPAKRCTTARLRELLAGGPVMEVAPREVPTEMREAPTEIQERLKEAWPPAARTAVEGGQAGGSRMWVGVLAVLVLVAVIGLWLHARRAAPPNASGEQAVAAGQGAAQSGEKQRPSGGPEQHGAVLQQVLPDVPAPAMRTIDGTVRLSIRVAVDASGSVTEASVQDAGSSPYFVPFALDAARKWRFAPAHAGGRAIPSAWVLHFELQQSGIEVHPEEAAP